MNKKFYFVLFAAVIILPLVFFGCKGKVDKAPEAQLYESQPQAPQATDNLVTTEPAQTVATETIPPTAAPEVAPKPVAPAKVEAGTKNKDVQTALKNAGFYAGTIDGKIGPKTKSAIMAFQKAKGLNADGKVGPKTWAELEKYLIQQQQ